MPDAVGVQQAHGTLPLNAMMSSNHLAAAPGVIPQQQAHVLQSSVIIPQQLHGQRSPGQLPAYSGPTAVPLAVQLQQMSLGGVQISSNPSSQAAGVPSTAAMSALMTPQLASTGMGMPPATVAVADHGARLLLDPQQQQQQMMMMPVGTMQQYMMGSYGASGQGNPVSLTPM
jgi:hypothetical protein